MAIYSLVIVAFVSVLLFIIFLNERELILDLALENSTKISTMHADNLNQEFTKYIAMLKLMSDNPNIKGNNHENIVGELQNLINVGNKQFINAIYVDKEHHLIDATGATYKVDHPLFLQGEQWKHKAYNITVPLKSKFEKEHVIIVAVPIFDENKMWTGTLAVAVPLNVISEKLSAIKLSQDSFAWLSDSNDLIVSHPEIRFAMNATLSMTENPNFPGFYKIVNKTKVQSSGYGRYNDAIKNEPKIVTFSKIDALPGWTLFITTKESEVFKEIDTILRNILLTSILLTLLFLLLINELSNRLTRPIIQLTEDVKAAVKEHDFYPKVIKSDDEIGLLSQAFHDSFKKISQHAINLEKMVASRTQEISEKNILLNEKNQKLAEIASKDPLTQLYNRRAFNTLLDEAIFKAKKQHHQLILVIIDIDDFKKINDHYGHTVGDDVLSRFAQALANNALKDVITCRWGGEEFVILIPEATLDVAFQHIELIRNNIVNMDFSPVAKVTFSAGMAIMQTDDTFNGWLQRADKALYDAKIAGKNCTLVSD